MIHTYIAKFNGILTNFRRRKCFNTYFNMSLNERKKNDKGNKYEYSMKVPL